MSSDLVLTLNNGIKTIRGAGGDADRGIVVVRGTAAFPVPDNTPTVVTFEDVQVQTFSTIPVDLAESWAVIPRPGIYECTFRVQWTEAMSGGIQIGMRASLSGGPQLPLDFPTSDGLDDTNAEVHNQWFSFTGNFNTGDTIQATALQTTGNPLDILFWTFTVLEVFP